MSAKTIKEGIFICFGWSLLSWRDVSNGGKDYSLIIMNCSSSKLLSLLKANFEYAIVP
jgi:hypothetical protein